MRIDRWFRWNGGAARVPYTGNGRPASGRATRWKMLASTDFRRLWTVGFVISAVRWLEMLAVGVFVYQHTGSAFDVALMTLLRMLPLALFGAVIGALAERVERRKALIGVVLLMMTTSLSLAVLAYAGVLAVWHLALASFCNGVAWATDNPVRRVMIGEVVGSENMGSAMSLDVGGNNASRMLGPTVGGVLLAYAGISGTFTASVLLYTVALAAAIGVQHRNLQAPGAVGSILARIVEGFVLVRREPRLLGTLLVTIIYNVFGWPFTAMIPVIGQDNLDLGASAIGALASMDGIGAFIGVVAIAVYARPAHYRLLYIGGVAYIHGNADRLRARAERAGSRDGAAADGSIERRVQRHAGDADLSGGAPGDAQPIIRSPVGVHRLGADRVPSARGAGGADRRFAGDRAFGGRWVVRAGGGLAVVARPRDGVIAIPPGQCAAEQRKPGTGSGVGCWPLEPGRRDRGGWMTTH